MRVARGLQQAEHLGDRDLARARQDQLPFPVRGAAGVLDLGEQDPGAEVGVDLGGRLAHPVRVMAVPYRPHLAGRHQGEQLGHG